MGYAAFPSALVILSALPVPAVAQAPAPTPTAFDGKYVGTATLTGGRGVPSCSTLTLVDMTITGGQVVIHEMVSNGHIWNLYGNVNAAGEVSTTWAPKNFPTVDSLSGIIHDKAFTGLHRHGYWCYWNVHMSAAPGLENTVQR